MGSVFTSRNNGVFAVTYCPGVTCRSFTAPANGAYEVALPLASPPREASTVTLTVAPPFVPSEHGSQDARALGLFVRSICLAAPAGS